MIIKERKEPKINTIKGFFYKIIKGNPSCYIYRYKKNIILQEVKIRFNQVVQVQKNKW